MRRRAGSPAISQSRRPLGSLRLLVLGVVVLALFGTLFGRLGQVQVLREGSFERVANVADTRVVVLPAVRGRILDHDGKPLADNTAEVAVTADRGTLLALPDDGRALLTRVATSLGVPFDRVWGRTFLCGTRGAPPQPVCWGGSAYVPVPLVERADPARALALSERTDLFPGIRVEVEPVRRYPAPSGVNLAHVLGYLGRTTQAEVDASKGTLTGQDLVGRAGLEQEYDTVLRGTPGRLVVAVDPRGIVQTEVSRTDPVPGADLITNLDVAVQVSAERALATQVATAHASGKKADSGAAVVLDTRTGAVVAAASYPTYDPNVWTRGISSADLAHLSDQAAGTPLVARATAATYPPASTFKVVSLPAAITAGNDIKGTYDCSSTYAVGNRQFHNYESRSYGPIDLERAIVVSCDTIFYAFAHRSWLAQGGLAATDDSHDPFVASAKAFGLGQATGIDLPGEAGGRIPDRAWKLSTWQATRATTCAKATSGYPDVARTDPTRAAYLKRLAVENCRNGSQFRAGDAANFAIGQGDIAVTPVQMADVFAAVANGGRLLTPRVAAATVATDGNRQAITAPSRAPVRIAAPVLSLLHTALRGVVEQGTASSAFAGFPADWPVAGKTGTGEVFGQDETSWFVSYAPSDKPEYAVAVVISQGGLGGGAAAPANRAIQAALRQLARR